MKRKIHGALASLAAAVVLACAGPADAAAAHEGHGHQAQAHSAKHKRARATRQRARSRKRTTRRAVSYVCPMHPDIRERKPDTCPKCGMDLVAERRAAKRAEKHEESPAAETPNQ